MSAIRSRRWVQRTAALAAIVAVTAACLAFRPLAVSTVASPVATRGDTLAILYSGDGGWAPLDRGLTRVLVADGMPVVGVNSLRYFWTARTPQAGATDLAALARRYMAAWNRPRLVLIGYSFGADALPPLIAQLPADLKAKIRYVALVSPEPAGGLQARPPGWLDRPSSGEIALPPAVARLAGLRLACLYGAAERRSGCAVLPAGAATVIRLPGGHHYGGDFTGLARAILKWGGR